MRALLQLEQKGKGVVLYMNQEGPRHRADQQAESLQTAGRRHGYHRGEHRPGLQGPETCAITGVGAQILRSLGNYQNAAD